MKLPQSPMKSLCGRIRQNSSRQSGSKYVEQMAMGCITYGSMRLHANVDEHPFATCFDV